MKMQNTLRKSLSAALITTMLLAKGKNQECWIKST